MDPKPSPTSRTPLVLGIEGGGTKTVAWFAVGEPNSPEAEILGRGISGPSNPHAVDWDVCFESLLEAIQEASRDAGWTDGFPEADAACLTMAGVDREQEAVHFMEWATANRLGREIHVTNDSVGLLAAGTEHGWGIALVAGTGSIAFGQNSSGQTTRTGGWGYRLGDEGSAYALAIAGLRSAVRFADGRDPETQLLPDFLGRLELSRPEDLLEAVYLSERDRTWIASLADVVTQAADAGDAVAISLVDEATTELAKLVETTAKKLSLDTGPLPVCYTGGLILNTPCIQSGWLRKLNELVLQVPHAVAVPDPVWGAIKLARGLLPPGTDFSSESSP